MCGMPIPDFREMLEISHAKLESRDNTVAYSIEIIEWRRKGMVEMYHSPN